MADILNGPDSAAAFAQIKAMIEGHQIDGPLNAIAVAQVAAVIAKAIPAPPPYSVPSLQPYQIHTRRHKFTISGQPFRSPADSPAYSPALQSSQSPAHRPAPIIKGAVNQDVCWICKTSGHDALKCPDIPKGVVLVELEDDNSDCDSDDGVDRSPASRPTFNSYSKPSQSPAHSPAPTLRRTSKVCWICDQPGHRPINCVQSVCWICRCQGHAASLCPEKPEDLIFSDVEDSDGYSDDGSEYGSDEDEDYGEDQAQDVQPDRPPIAVAGITPSARPSLASTVEGTGMQMTTLTDSAAVTTTNTDKMAAWARGADFTRLINLVNGVPAPQTYQVQARSPAQPYKVQVDRLASTVGGTSMQTTTLTNPVTVTTVTADKMATWAQGADFSRLVNLVNGVPADSPAQQTCRVPADHPASADEGTGMQLRDAIWPEGINISQLTEEHDLISSTGLQLGNVPVMAREHVPVPFLDHG